jgi:hypothetical protein
MLTIIPLPEGFVDDITGHMGDIITDLSPYITLVLGVVLGLTAVGIILSFLRK